ncbi:hypothetical protein [Paenibacillus sp. BK720]|uniref:hypothetical protein n=1 Tax=Paenibacillus sp. BK720 TaxID=2587092 RepID=UPI0014234B2B|nr:hypothetical protein [Paenibacillus sp. BK720]NIK71390.1 hypothetical protein [Paenibacillus sp. BK720]
MSEDNIHETQPQREQIHPQYVDEQLYPLQNVEGGGPLRKPDLSTMPRPIRVIGFLIITSSVIIAASVILVDLFR